MALELYLDLFSQPCRSVFIFAKKNNIPFVFKNIKLFEGEQYGEDFGKINMIRKVPAIRDGDFTMGESIAILMYMAEKFRTPDHWYPADLQKRALVNEYLSWQHTATRMHGSKIFWLKLMIPKVMKMEVPKEKMDSAIEDLEGSLKIVEEKFLQDKPFIAGEHISLADLVAIVEIMQVQFRKKSQIKTQLKHKNGGEAEAVEHVRGLKSFESLNPFESLNQWDCLSLTECR